MEADPWASFSHDPRRQEFATLRASDADREVVRQTLAEAYADGRLDREELDERSDAVEAARTLGDLPLLLDGLVPVAGSLPARPYGDLTPETIQRQAVERWESERRQALGTFLLPTLICWIIFVATGADSFPWPVFVTLGTGFHLFNVHLHKRDIIARQVRSLEKKQRKELETRRTEHADDPEETA